MSHFLTTRDLAERWRVSQGTLRNWRCAGKGPPYVTIGGGIRYDIKDVQLWEMMNPSETDEPTSPDKWPAAEHR